jgi:hypothetical protein
MSFYLDIGIKALSYSMGVEQSRLASLPDNIDSNYEEYKKAWHSDKLLSLAGSEDQKSPGSTLFVSIISLACDRIVEFFKISETKLSVLEVMAGNGYGSNLLYDGLSQKLGQIEWTATEIQKLKPQGKLPIISECDAVDAVGRYGSKHNTLLMMSPPPGSSFANYGDYFAINAWAKLDNSKFVIIIGELGASDGSEGMYKYMLENPVWICKDRNVIYDAIDMLGGPILKEVFIFEKGLFAPFNHGSLYG